MSRENNRSKMPQVTAFIDDLRAAFGVDEIDNVIRRGLHADCKSEQRFFAAEAGYEMGQRYVPSGVVVSGLQMMLDVVKEEDDELATATRKRGRYR